METGLRIVLLLVAVMIVAGIVWDTFRSRRKPLVKKPKKNYRVDRLEIKKNIDKLDKLNNVDSIDLDSHDHDSVSVIDSALDILTEDVVTVKSSSSNSTKNKPKESARESARTKEHHQEQNQDMDTVFVLNIMAKQPGIFLGKKLIDVFDEAHLFYGDMQIFHRYENADGSGKHMFSLASAIEPGFFDLNTLESYVTPGLTLFFSPTTRNHSIAAFELMLRTAKILAAALDGEIKDQNRRPLTLEGIEKYRKTVRESVKLHRASSVRG